MACTLAAALLGSSTRISACALQTSDWNQPGARGHRWPPLAPSIESCTLLAPVSRQRFMVASAIDALPCLAQ